MIDLLFLYSGFSVAKFKWESFINNKQNKKNHTYDFRQFSHWIKQNHHDLKQASLKEPPMLAAPSNMGVQFQKLFKRRGTLLGKIVSA